jgi:hypothetical protein
MLDLELGQLVNPSVCLWIVLCWLGLQVRSQADQAKASASQARPAEWLEQAWASGLRFLKPSQAMKLGLEFVPSGKQFTAMIWVENTFY